jgi:hypothetical protein
LGLTLEAVIRVNGHPLLDTNGGSTGDTGAFADSGRAGSPTSSRPSALDRLAQVGNLRDPTRVDPHRSGLTERVVQRCSRALDLPVS